MSAKDTGGPAFPQPILDIGGGSGIVAADEVDLGGMTLRDYFATHADVSKLEVNNQETAEIIVGRKMPDDHIGHIIWQYELIAKIRYIAADAMLREREK